MAMSKVVAEKLAYYASQRQTAVTLRQMYEFGLNPTSQKRLTSARLMRREVPIRLAHRVIELSSLPDGLSDMPSIRIVRDMYIKAFSDMLQFPPEVSPEDSKPDGAFNNQIRTLRDRHEFVVPIIARGVLEYKAQKKHTGVLDPSIQRFLDRFFMSRLGIRFLVGQHLAILSEQRPGFVGIIQAKCRPVDLIQEAVDHARNLCLSHYDNTPEVSVHGKVNLEFPYITSHLYYMVFELIKNSLRATVENCGRDCADLPKVKIIIAEGHEDIAIKISDEGGGIARSGMPHIWTYMYSTAPPPSEGIEFEMDGIPPIAGFGIGLPITRLHARYFGGDLQLISMDGYGTDAYLYLRKLGDIEESLPGDIPHADRDH